MLGVAEGILAGQLEARMVIGELSKKTETVIWQIMPINVVLFVLPLVLVIGLFGSSEILPFAAYFVFPFIPTFLSTSGWLYNEFEKEQKVQIFMFIYGFKYWIEPIVDISHEFIRFIEAVISKDLFGILHQASYSQKFMTMLEERAEIESSTKNFLSKILETAKKYHRLSLACFLIFIVSCLSLIIYFFVLVSTNAFGLIEIVDGKIVSGQAIGLILGCVPTFSIFFGVIGMKMLLNKKYQKQISTLLASLNLDVLPGLKLK